MAKSPLSRFLLDTITAAAKADVSLTSVTISQEAVARLALEAPDAHHRYFKDDYGIARVVLQTVYGPLCVKCRKPDKPVDWS